MKNKNEIFAKAWVIISRKWETEGVIVIQKYARTFLVKRKHWKKILKIRKARFFFKIN